MAGFKSPAFWLGLSAGIAVTQGGYRTPLPGWNAGGSAAVVQGGYVTPLPFWRAGASSTPQEAGGDIYYSRLHEELREEEEILGIIQAFLHTRG